VEAHAKLSGTIYSVAEEVRQAGGQAIALKLNINDENSIINVVDQAVEKFGGIDVLINNASAIGLTSTSETTTKRLDLMWGVNMRGTFLMSQACIPHLKKANNPHILTMSPPLNMDPKWFSPHLAYTMSKYGMSLCTLGMAQEYVGEGIAVNCLWPSTTIATAAIEFNFPPELLIASRKPAIVADAAYMILQRDSRECTGNFFVDETVLREAGVDDFEQYAVTPGKQLQKDFFLD
jgi:citronellol/citronellal dehydrogenase